MTIYQVGKYLRTDKNDRAIAALRDSNLTRRRGGKRRRGTCAGHNP